MTFGQNIKFFYDMNITTVKVRITKKSYHGSAARMPACLPACVYTVYMKWKAT
jgi:hypothetical protein